MKNLLVSDTTLSALEEKDISLTFREKLFIAEKLDASGVDAIELPALINSKENEVIFRTIAATVKNAIVKIPVGASVDSVKAAYECVKGAAKFCLQVVMPISTVQMEYFYHAKAPAMQQKIGDLITSAKQLCDCVEFVAHDAFRAEEGFLESCVKTAYDAGACAVTVCDDAGVALFEDYSKIVNTIKSVCPIKVFVQPSNALSLAGACAIEAIKAGVDGVKTSAIGETLSLSVFSDIIKSKTYDLDVCCNVDGTNVNTIVATINHSVEEGDAGFEPKTVDGALDSNATIKEVAAVVNQLGYELSDEDVGKVYEEFKKLTSKKEAIDAKELEAVVASTAMQVPSTYHLVNYVVNSGNIIPATANITLEKDGEKITGVSTGDGPIDAAFHAIEQIIGHHYELDDFQVHAVTKGRGAVGSSIIRLRANGKLYPGNGVSTDIVGACIRAYVNALNKIVYEEN